MSNRVIHFEIQVEDVNRAKKFYGDVFGWTFEDYSDYVWSPYFGVMTAPEGSKDIGINGGLLLRPWTASAKMSGTNAFVCTIWVEDYDTMHEKILTAGWVVALPKAALPGMAWQGYYLDTEENVFGIHQPDTDAK